MKWFYRIFIGFCLVITIFSLVHCQEVVSDYSITSMTASLFYNQINTFSQNILDNPNFILWNTIIGEGSAEGDSSQTLVAIEITGEPGAYQYERTIEFIARTEEKVIQSLSSSIGILSETGKYYITYLLHDTGCVPIEISVSIKGQKTRSMVKKVIDFRCGE